MICLTLIMEVGEIWSMEEPLVNTMCGSQLERRCDKCLSPSTKLLKCSACGISSYCNRICQLGLLYQKQCTVFGKSRTFNDFVSNTAIFMQNPRRLDEFARVLNDLKSLSIDDGTLPGPTEFMEICGKIKTNSFGISDIEKNHIGVGVYLRCSALKHSCQANAVAVFTGTTLTIRCIERVPHESQLRISYINHLATTSERRRKLEEQYGFTCQCPLCLDTQLDAMKVSMSCPTIKCDGFILQNTEQKYTCTTCSTVVKWEEYTDQYSSAVRLAKDMVETVDKQQGSADDILKQCTECLGNVSKILHPLNIYCVQLRERLMLLCGDQHRWSQALTYIQANTPHYRKYLPKRHPNLGIHLCSVGNLQAWLGQHRCAMDSFQQALDILQVSHGKDHSLCQAIFFRLKAVEYAALSD